MRRVPKEGVIRAAGSRNEITIRCNNIGSEAHKLDVESSLPRLVLIEEEESRGCVCLAKLAMWEAKWLSGGTFRKTVSEKPMTRTALEITLSFSSVHACCE